MQARVSPPERIEKPSPSVLQKKVLPNRPKTIDGTPARTSRLRRIIRPNRLWSDVNSARRTAVPIPMGRDTARQTPRIKDVETKIGPIPPRRPAFSGGAVRNVQEIWLSPCQTMSPNSQQNTAVTSPAAPQTRTNASPSRGGCSRLRVSAIHSPATDPLRREDKRHNHGHQDESADEQRSAMVSERIGHFQGDIGGQRPDRVEDAGRSLHHVSRDHQNRHRFPDGSAGLQDHPGKQA